MSRRGNNVRGPTSALTEFLREAGITTALIAQRVRQGEGQAGPSNAASDLEEEAVAQPSPRRRPSYADDGIDSDNLDEPEDYIQTGRKRKMSKKELEKLKASEKVKAKKKRRYAGEEDDDSDEDEYTALSKSVLNGGRAANAKPPVGSFDNCAKCEKQFTVTKYTIAAVPPPGYLCHDCAKASGTNPFKKPAAPRKRKTIDEKRKVISFEEKEFPSLASVCIKIIGKYIDDVEALGDIGAVNMHEIGRVLTKNRSLNGSNCQLLYDAKNTNLALYDVTKLDPDAFCTMASLNPALQSLRLDLCGRLDDDALKHWATHFPDLTRLELHGPFLARTDGWKLFFESHPRLTGFLIRQSPRFDLSCLDSLLKHCPNITELRLAEIGKMSDEFLPLVASFGQLHSLDLSGQTSSLSPEAVVTLLSQVGGRLTQLNLSQNELLDDTVLLDGLLPHARVLDTLIMEDLPELTDEAVGDFFSSTENTAMHHISFRRNHALADNALEELIEHSGEALTFLDINNMKDVSVAALKIIANAKTLKKLDVGFCRQVDDFVIKEIIEGCEQIIDISCFGCNRLTENCPRKRGVNILGFEGHTA